MASEASASEDILRLLVQRVGRAFYDDKCVVVLDMLLNYQGMSTDVLAQKVQMPIKQLQSNLNRMEKDHLLAWELGSLKMGRDNKPIKTKIYFINYKRFVDSVKYKIMMIRARLQSFATHKEEEIFYFRCPGWCQRQFSMIDALQLKREVYTGAGFEFICDKCDVPLTEIDNSETVQGGQQQQQKLIDQLKPFTDMLRKTEELIIPSYTGSPADEVMEKKEYEEYKRLEAEHGGPSGSGGIYARKQNAPDYYQKLEKEIEVRIQDVASTKADNRPKSQPLPPWMQGSTIGAGRALKRQRLDGEDDGDDVAGGAAGSEAAASVTIKPDEDGEEFATLAPLTEQPADYIESYYNQLLQQQDEEQEEFEEVPVPEQPPGTA